MSDIVMEYRAKLASLTPHNKQIWDLAHRMMHEVEHAENMETQGLPRAAQKHHDASRKAEDDLLDLLALP